jgi:hypothetical protein
MFERRQLVANRMLNDERNALQQQINSSNEALFSA